MSEVVTPPVAPPAPPVAEAPASGDSGQDWGRMTAEAEGDEPDVEALPLIDDSDEAAPPAPKDVTPPAPPVVAAPTPPPVVEPPKVEPPAAVTPPPVAQPVQPPQVQPQQAQVEMDRLRESYVKELETQYKLNEEDAAKFVLNPNEVIPRLAANLHANIFQQTVATVMQTIQNVLPQLVGQVQDTRSTSQKNEEKFFTRWPELKEHRDTVMQVGRLWRAQNPNASVDDFVEKVGISSWMSTNLSVADLAARLDKVAPAATPTPLPQVQPTPTGYRPASPAAGAPPQSRTVEENPFALLASEMKEDFF